MANLEKMKSSKNEKKEVIKRTKQAADALKEEISKNEKIPAKEVEKSISAFYDFIEKDTKGGTPEGKKIIKKALDKFAEGVRKNPGKYLEKNKNEKGLKYKFKRKSFGVFIKILMIYTFSQKNKEK